MLPLTATRLESYLAVSVGVCGMLAHHQDLTQSLDGKTRSPLPNPTECAAAALPPVYTESNLHLVQVHWHGDKRRSLHRICLVLLELPLSCGETKRGQDLAQ